jgi:hypothetical protein
MDDLQLTKLEKALLGAFAARFARQGFPQTDDFEVVSRNDTGAGRFTYLKHVGRADLPSGQIGLGTFSQVDMDGLDCGASFWVEVASGQIDHLEIVVNGAQPWSGVETAWIIRDPDTGVLP